MKKIYLLLIIFAFAPNVVFAQYFTVGGIHYNVISTAQHQVEVTRSQVLTEKYSGDIVIPSSVNYSSATYSVVAVGDTAFSACSALTSVQIPPTVTRIGNHAFRNCTSLAWPGYLPPNLTRIGNSAFYGCTNCVGTLNLPSSITYIGTSAFFNCTGLVGYLDLPAALDTLHTNSFAWCSGLSGPLVLPDNLRFIGAEPFALCDGIISVTDTVTIPEQVFYIGFHSFRAFTNLHVINFNPINCITMVDELDSTRLAFRDCNAVTTINIGPLVTQIPHFGFAGLSSVQQINSDAITPPTIYVSSFKSIDKNIPVYVPCDIAAYHAAQYWSSFTNLHAVGSVSVPHDLQATNDDAGVKLQWQGEATNYYIYRNNTQIATVSTTTYTDTENLPHGTYCYQIHVKNSNEVCPDALSNEVCVIIASVNDINTKHFNIYPVPANDRIFIDGDTDFTDISILDIYGREVIHSQKVVELNISALPQGSYIVNILNKGISIERIKIIKD